MFFGYKLKKLELVAWYKLARVREGWSLGIGGQGGRIHILVYNISVI